jgi:hypothetical protein
VRGLFVAVVGALAIAASAFGLALDGFRAGPFDRPLEPVTVAAQVEGTYLSRPASTTPLGLCIEPPCEARTDLDARFHGLPPVPYDLSLQAASQGASAGASSSEPLGTFEPDGQGTLVVRWSQDRDHGDKDRLVLTVAGRDVGSVPLSGGPPVRLSGEVALSWGAPPADLHVNEIGGVVMSSIATTRLDEVAPRGWEFRARFEAPGRVAEFGALETDRGAAVLDGRVERLRLEDYSVGVIVVAPLGASAGAGFPVLLADLWP